MAISVSGSDWIEHYSSLGVTADKLGYFVIFDLDQENNTNVHQPMLLLITDICQPAKPKIM